MNSVRVVLAHDWLVGLRGGEHVLDRLAQRYGPTQLYTLVASRSDLTEAIGACDVITSPLQKLPGASGRLRRAYLPIMPRAVERLARRVTRDCDLLISTSSAVIKSLSPPDGVPHLCYCHSPARYIWDQLDEYGLGRGGKVRQAGLRAVRRRFQHWDRATASRVTKFLANSKHTADRIKRCFDREADVVYPPIETDYFQPDPNARRETWFLVVAALEPYKRTDIVIEAANRMGFSLKVAGTGSQQSHLRRIAGSTVEMLGYVPKDQLKQLYQRANALIFPQQEDFGMTAVEAQAAGCPVIAYAAGGALETVTNETGVFFDTQNADALAEAIRRFNSTTICSEACRANALRFSPNVFDEQIAKHIGQLVGTRKSSAACFHRQRPS